MSKWLKPMVIYKYHLELVPRQEIALPIYAHLLSIQLQRDTVCLWAAVHPSNETQPLRIILVGTGHEIPVDAERYLGTVQQDGCVWHFFSERGAVIDG